MIKKTNLYLEITVSDLNKKHLSLKCKILNGAGSTIMKLTTRKMTLDY